MAIILLLFNLTPKVDSLILRSIELSYQEEFARSESLLKIVINETPDNPAPYFCLASLYELMWVDLGCDSFAVKFFSYSDSSIMIANEWVKKHPDDAWGYFFVGGAYTIRIFYYALNGDAFKGLSFVGPALKALSRCQAKDPGISDVYLGLGGWEYFKGHFPLLNSKKKKGLSMIKRASENAKYVSLYATLAYAQILLREQNFQETISILTPLVDYFPNSRTLTWPLLKAYFGGKDYENALKMADRLINLSEDNKYSNFSAHYYKVKILMALKRLRGAVNTSEEALEIDVDINAPDVKSMREELDKTLKELYQRIGIE